MPASPFAQPKEKSAAPLPQELRPLDIIDSVQTEKAAAVSTSPPERMPLPQEFTPEAARESGGESHENLSHEETPSATENEPGVLDETISGLKHKLRQTKKKPVAVPQVRDEITLQVEKIMEDGLRTAWSAMTPVQQQTFKIKGEETAMKIRGLLRGTHIKIKKIFLLLLEWLKLIPGVNRFFLEQEAKIKADKIIALNEILKHK